MLTIVLILLFIYLFWGSLIGVVNRKLHGYPWFAVPIIAVIWFPAAMGVKVDIKIGKHRIKIRKDEF